MKKVIFPEHLGQLDGDALLQALVSMNPDRGVADSLRRSFSGGFSVTAGFEVRVYETEAERNQLVSEVQSIAKTGKFQDVTLGVIYPPGKKLVWLVLEPLTPLE